jgi:methionyl-tRNA formyltransferase
MKIFIISQEDNFVIPKNIVKIIKTNGMQVIAISSIESKYSLISKKSYFFKGFGLFQGLKMGSLFIYNKIYNLLDIFTRTKLLPQRKSLRSVALNHHLPFFKTTNPNSDEYIDKVKSFNPDILVSFSAPLVFKEKLLRIAPMGCINLHCSYLPMFAGLMPCFWVLFKRADYTGVSVHYMDNKIDNGPILGQVKINYDNAITMFELIKQTKDIGGDLTCKILIQIKYGTQTTVPNNIYNGSYFSWPTIEDMRLFRKMGGKFI